MDSRSKEVFMAVSTWRIEMLHLTRAIQQIVGDDG